MCVCVRVSEKERERCCLILANVLKPITMLYSYTPSGILQEHILAVYFLLDMALFSMMALNLIDYVLHMPSAFTTHPSSF